MAKRACLAWRLGFLWTEMTVPIVMIPNCPWTEESVEDLAIAFGSHAGVTPNHSAETRRVYGGTQSCCAGL